MKTDIALKLEQEELCIADGISLLSTLTRS